MHPFKSPDSESLLGGKVNSRSPGRPLNGTTLSSSQSRHDLSPQQKTSVQNNVAAADEATTQKNSPNTITIMRTASPSGLFGRRKTTPSSGSPRKRRHKKTHLGHKLPGRALSTTRAPRRIANQRAKRRCFGGRRGPLPLPSIHHGTALYNAVRGVGSSIRRGRAQVPTPSSAHGCR